MTDKCTFTYMTPKIEIHSITEKIPHSPLGLCLLCMHVINNADIAYTEIHL